MFTILSAIPRSRTSPDAMPLVVTERRVRFEDVHFAYDPGASDPEGHLVRGAAGQTVAIVGPSGAGKSTISRLLFRFYEPTSGRILIDGQDIARRPAGVAARGHRHGSAGHRAVQRHHRLQRALRPPGRDRREVGEAARLAQIDRFIGSLPEGYETSVGERGLKLSGGEKQRVAIARTILKGPPILVLDEATSALDSFTEKEIQDALDRVSSGRTTLVIAHRLSTVIDADEIIVLDQGPIVERGTHADLLTESGVYAAMWNRQREAEEARETLKRAEEAEEPSLRESRGRSRARGRGSWS